MKTLVINNNTYKLPEWVVENNAKAEDFYGVLSVQEIFTGREDFDRIDSENGDWFESQCFEAYGNHFGVNGDDAPINVVGETMYAWITDYDREDWTMIVLEKA